MCGCARASVSVIVTSLSTVVTIMLKRTGTKQRSDDRTTDDRQINYKVDRWTPNNYI